MSSFFKASAKCDPQLMRASAYHPERALREVLDGTEKTAEQSHELLVASKERTNGFKDHVATSFVDSATDTKARSAAHQVNVYDRKCGRRFAPPVEALPKNITTPEHPTHPVDKLHIAVRGKMVQELEDANPTKVVAMDRRLEVLLDDNECF